MVASYGLILLLLLLFFFSFLLEFYFAFGCGHGRFLLSVFFLNNSKSNVLAVTKRNEFKIKIWCIYLFLRGICHMKTTIILPMPKGIMKIIITIGTCHYIFAQCYKNIIEPVSIAKKKLGFLLYWQFFLKNFYIFSWTHFSITFFTSHTSNYYNIFFYKNSRK